MPFLLIGIILGMPLGVVAYFKLIAEADINKVQSEPREKIKHVRK